MRCSAQAPTPSSSGRRSCVTRTPRGNCRSCGMVEASAIRKKGRFGRFGGQYVPETLMPALHELEAAYDEAKTDPSFRGELESYFCHYGGRPPPPVLPPPPPPNPSGGPGFPKPGGRS